MVTEKIKNVVAQDFLNIYHFKGLSYINCLESVFHINVFVGLVCAVINKRLSKNAMVTEKIKNVVAQDFLNIYHFKGLSYTNCLESVFFTNVFVGLVCTVINKMLSKNAMVTEKIKNVVAQDFLNIYDFKGLSYTNCLESVFFIYVFVGLVCTVINKMLSKKTMVTEKIKNVVAQDFVNIYDFKGLSYINCFESVFFIYICFCRPSLYSNKVCF